MRKACTLTFYLAMIAIGLWVTYDWVFLGGRDILFRAGSFLALFGAYLLWIDFLSPSRKRI
jgi:hypothetical protein